MANTSYVTEYQMPDGRNMNRICRQMELPTHRIRPTALGRATVAIMPVAAESNPCPAQTRRVSVEDVSVLAAIERGNVDDIWDIIVAGVIVACVKAATLDVPLDTKIAEANSWGKRAILEGEA